MSCAREFEECQISNDNEVLFCLLDGNAKIDNVHIQRSSMNFFPLSNICFA